MCCQSPGRGADAPVFAVGDAFGERFGGRFGAAGYDPQTQKVVATMTGHSGEVRAGAVCPGDGSRLLVLDAGSGHGCAMAKRQAGGGAGQTLGAEYAAIASSPDGSRIRSLRAGMICGSGTVSRGATGPAGRSGTQTTCCRCARLAWMGRCSRPEASKDRCSFAMCG